MGSLGAIDGREGPAPSLVNPTAHEDLGSAIFVWGSWATLLAVALGFVYRYGSHVPYVEDWYYVDILTNKRDITLSWLWEQLPRADHRVPLFKLLIYLDYKLFGLNVLPFLYLNVLLFAALSASMIWAARRLRGATSYADAFFPIVLLNIGQGEAFLWAEASVYVITTSFVGAILISLVGSRSRMSPSAATAVGTCLIMLPLCFGGGVTYVPFLALWMGYVGLRLARSPERDQRRAGRLLLIFATIACILVVAYIADYRQSRFDEREELASSRVSPLSLMKATLKYVTMSLGPAVRPPLWPLSGLMMMGFLSVSVACLAASLWRRTSRRDPLVLGLSLYMVACLVTSIAVGWSRASWSRDYLFCPRYAASAAPIILGIYFVWEACGPPRAVPFGRMVLFTFVTVNLTNNCTIGLYETGWGRNPLGIAFEQDVREGVPIPLLVSKYAPTTHHDHDKIEAYLKALRDAKIGDFRFLPPDPRFREVRLPLDPVAVHHVEWHGKAGKATGDRPYLIFNLEKPMFVCGLRIKYSNVNKEGLNPYFQVFYRNSEDDGQFEQKRYFHVDLPTGGEEVEIPVWTYDTLDQIRIHPDKRPCDFTISEIVLMMPDQES